jgi:hypothetical protein
MYHPLRYGRPARGEGDEKPVNAILTALDKHRSPPESFGFEKYIPRKKLLFLSFSPSLGMTKPGENLQKKIELGFLGLRD